MLFLSKT